MRKLIEHADRIEAALMVATVAALLLSVFA